MVKDTWYESSKCDLAHIKNAPGRVVFFRIICRMLINAFDTRHWLYRRDKRKISNMVRCAARIRRNDGRKRYLRRIYVAVLKEFLHC